MLLWLAPLYFSLRSIQASKGLCWSGILWNLRCSTLSCRGTCPNSTLQPAFQPAESRKGRRTATWLAPQLHYILVPFSREIGVCQVCSSFICCWLAFWCPYFYISSYYLSQLILPLVISSIDCAFLGAIFHYTVRWDLDNLQLKKERCTAFGFI